MIDESGRGSACEGAGPIEPGLPVRNPAHEQRYTMSIDLPHDLWGGLRFCALQPQLG
jgi:hypothetical protein